MCRGIYRREKRGKLEECGRKRDRRGREEGGKGWERSRGRRRKGIGERGRRRRTRGIQYCGAFHCGMYGSIVSFPDPNNPSADHFQYLARGRRVWGFDWGQRGSTPGMQAYSIIA